MNEKPKLGRPPDSPMGTADAQIQLRTTPQRKTAYTRAAVARNTTLAAFLFRAADEAAGYSDKLEIYGPWLAPLQHKGGRAVFKGRGVDVAGPITLERKRDEDGREYLTGTFTHGDCDTSLPAQGVLVVGNLSLHVGGQVIGKLPPPVYYFVVQSVQRLGPAC